MNMEKPRDSSMGGNFDKYYEISLTLEVPKLLQRAVSLVENKGIAIDIGAGHLRDSQYLAQEGFAHVVAFDKNPDMLQYQTSNTSDIITCDLRDIHEYNFPADSFDLVYINKTLHYMRRSVGYDVWKKVVDSVRPGGILSAVTFGPRDEWAKNDTLYFPSVEEINESLNDFRIIRQLEKYIEQDITAKDTQKHSHYIITLAKKHESN